MSEKSTHPTNWTTKAAQEIYDKTFADEWAPDRMTLERIEAILEAHAAPLIQLLRESKREHYHCNDSWYCCAMCTHPDHGALDGHSGEAARVAGFCGCGAEVWNARVDAALKEGL